MTSLKETLRKLAPEFGFLLESQEGDDQASQIEKNVLNKLETSVKFDEVDTVTFGLETDDGKIVKVYVKSDQSSDFEKALSDMLGKVDDIEKVLNDLSADFDIVDVEWPNEEQTSDPDQITGSEVMDPKVYGNAKEKAEMDSNLKSNLESLSDESAELELNESSQTIESRLTTATQLMVYHALIELGIPEIVLTRSPYRASIIRSIRTKADELNKNSTLKSALKMFIKRTDDFDKKARDNEAADAKEGQLVIKEDKCEWEFVLDGDEFTLSCSQLTVTLGAEESERMIKGVTNRDAVVVRDSVETNKKFVFSPRGSSVVVKQVGSSEGFTMTSKDVDEMLSAISPKKE